MGNMELSVSMKIIKEGGSLQSNNLKVSVNKFKKMNLPNSLT